MSEQLNGVANLARAPVTGPWPYREMAPQDVVARSGSPDEVLDELMDMAAPVEAPMETVGHRDFPTAQRAMTEAPQAREPRLSAGV